MPFQWAVKRNSHFYRARPDEKWTKLLLKRRKNLKWNGSRVALSADTQTLRCIQTFYSLAHLARCDNFYFVNISIRAYKTL